MKHSECVRLLEKGVLAKNQVWTEFGSGYGAFTLALAELIQPDGIIFSVDVNNRALNFQKKEVQRQFPNFEVHYINADFMEPLRLPLLNGILMANAIHYIKEKESFIPKIRNYLKTNGRFLIVEYNIDKGNHWVPYPISFKSWQPLAIKCGFREIRLLNTISSKYHNEIYSAVSYKN